MQATSRLLSAGMDDPHRSETLDLGLAPDSQVVRVVRSGWPTASRWRWRRRR